MKQLLPRGAALAATLCLGWARPALAQPTLQQSWPAANATAAAPAAGVLVQFGLAPGKQLHQPFLWVFSAQRGGRRTYHSGQLERTGQQLFFRPSYDFLPGEVVHATTWASRVGNPVAQAQQWQFTVAVGGTDEGHFGPGADLAAPALAPGLALGDVDGDGDLDAVTASTAASQVRVRLNSGAGQYNAGTLVDVGYPSYSLALGDVDGDGDLDLVTGSDSNGLVSICLNGGDATGSNTGRFGGGAEVPVGSRPQRLALADVDHDGDLDLLAACTGAGTVSVRPNEGSTAGGTPGRFGGGSDVAVGASPMGLALGDIDGDLDLDFLATSPVASQLNVRLNRPWPPLATATVPPPSQPDYLQPLHLGWQVQAYPNPLVQALTLTIRTDQSGPATLVLADALGRQLSEPQLVLSPGTTTLPLPATQDLASGAYLLQVRQGSQRQLIRLVRP